MSFDWKKVLRAVAPTLVGAIGGPVGSVAANALSAALGIPPGEDELEKKVATLTAADLLSLKNAEQQFVKDMKALDLDFEKVAQEDRSNARAREIATHDWMPRALGLSVFALFAFVTLTLARWEIPLANRDAANQILGILYAAVVSVLGYYFGSSAGSRSKDASIRDMVNQK